ncbi:CDP-glycerol glycerophosphotransferase family protein [Desulfococcus sp.]|uniref:CDP-glycerol glycerophosphotransferase family protein n=1 Tax=Desulfococcus sp. TaxID=2025834 RepID=UPI0035948625
MIASIKLDTEEKRRAALLDPQRPSESLACPINTVSTPADKVNSKLNSQDFMKNLFNPRLMNAWYVACRQTVVAILARIIGFPLSCLIRRDPELMLVINRPGSSFADNSKYFFAHASGMAGQNQRVVMLTFDRGIQKLIVDAGGESVFHPSLQSMYLLLRCGKVVIDMDWFKFGSYPLTIGAKLIQLWHGAPIKHIELDLFRKRLNSIPAWMWPVLKIQKWLIGRYPVYDVVVTTSQWFVDNVFSQCFNAKKFISPGYPRNDILFGWPESDSIIYRLAWINVDRNGLKKVTEAKSKGQKICLYVPTFRKELFDPFETTIDLSRFSKFAQKNNLLIVLKLHPFMHGHSQIKNYSNILEYNPLCDIYPLMPMCDLMITDYSSIFFDFLLLDRPILFFAYDLDAYLNHDRSMYFDYEVMTPGMKCNKVDQLELYIETILKNGCQDDYAALRQKIRACTHDHIDGKSNVRLISELLT